MGYTVSFEGHKGWPAVLGILGAFVGIATPYIQVMPVPVQVAVGIAGAIVAGFSNKPGATKAPVVTVNPATPQGVVTVQGNGASTPTALA